MFDRVFGTDKAGPCPALMINGDADQTIPYDAALQMYRDAHRLKGMISLAGIGHDLTVGTIRFFVTLRSGSSLTT